MLSRLQSGDPDLKRIEVPEVMEQLDLQLREPGKNTAPVGRLTDLVNVLRGKGWQTRRQLEALGFDERELREIVEHDSTGEIFSYPGSPGYKLYDEVTMEEFDRCVALKNQGDKMRHRWITYQRRRHGKIQSIRRQGASDES